MDAQENPTPPADPFDLDRLERMTAAQLHRLHRKLFGSDSAVSETLHLQRKIAWELQAQVEGRLPDAFLQLALTIAQHSVLRSRPLRPVGKKLGGFARSVADPRLPRPGACLMRTFQDRRIVVKVLASGFEFEGRYFDSLSAIARQVTGTRWNGFVFFGLERTSHARRSR